MHESHPSQRAARVTTTRVRAILATLCVVVMSGCSPGADSISEIRETQEAGQFAATIQPLRDMLDENPNQPEVSLLLGKALMRTGQGSSAIWPLRRAMESQDFVVEAGLMLARAELASRTPRDVLEAVARVLAIEPNNVEGLNLRAQGYIRAKRSEEALADLDRALELDPENLEALVPRVVVLIGLEKYEEAEKALARAKEVIETTTQPVRETLRGRLCVANGLFAFEKGEVERATTLYEECLAAYPTNRIVVSQAVKHYDRLKQPERATEILEKAQEEAEGPYFSEALARRMGRIGKLEEQEGLLRSEAEERPTARAWFALADFYVLRERYQEAGDAFEKSIEVDENPAPMTVFAYIDTLIQAERFDDARRQVQQLEQSYMRDLLEGRLLLATGDPQGALRSFESGLRLWPNNSTARFLAAQAAEQIGDFDRAIVEYREAIRKRKDVGETDAALNLSRILFDRGTPREALPSLLRYIKTHRRHREALLLMLQVGQETQNAKVVANAIKGLLKSGRPGLAMAQQVEVLAADSGPEAAIAAADNSKMDLNDPRNSLALRAVLEQLALLKRHDQAQERVAAALKLHPDSAEHHDLAGRVILAAGGDTLKAQAAFQRSLELQAERATALIGLAEIAAAAGAKDEAIELYDRAHASAPNDPSPSRAVIGLLDAEDRVGDRERRLAEMVTRDPRDAWAANALALSLTERKGDLDRALSYAKRAAYFTTVAEADETLGWVHLQRGENAAAVEVLEGVVDSRPEAARARYRLGLALAANGDLARARAELDAVIEAGGDEAEDARKEVARLAAPPPGE
jgi:tetratricopeptide (TPR) repeat protein